MLCGTVKATSRSLIILSVTALIACGGGGGGSATNQAPRFSSAIDFTFAENEAVDFVLEVTDPDSSVR